MNLRISPRPLRFLTSVAALLALLQPPLLLSSLRGDEATTASEKRLKESVTYLASDELEGRGVGTKGLDQAADFLAAEFNKLGLKTDLFDGTPFQKLKITTGDE